MARKKRQFLDDGYSDSPPTSDADDFEESNFDLREERELFENPYKQKRARKSDRKDDALYGVSGDGSDEETEVNKRTDWTKAPAFVSQQKVEPDQSMDVDQEIDASEPPLNEDNHDLDEPPTTGFTLGASKTRSRQFTKLTRTSFGSRVDDTNGVFGDQNFGARMLAKMGWVAGTGLGPEGEGRVAPVETKLRKKGMGLAFGGFNERTEQEKAEARRRGEIVSDDEDQKDSGTTATVKKASDVWKRPRKVKTRVEHKTYEEIIAEAGAEPSATGIGQIIDATGATLREVTSLADVSISSWTPTSDSRIPEVCHNVKLIVESSKGDLDGLAREARALEERKQWIRQEDARLRMKTEKETELIARLQQVHLVVDDITVQAKHLASEYEPSLELFSLSFDKLLGQFPNEFELYRLDEIVVAAIAPTIRRMLVNWKPLEDPTLLIPTFQLWRRALKVTTTETKPESSVQVYGSTISTTPTIQPMSPFESWLWHAWLPKVRSAINNDWLPQDPSPAIKLYEVWSKLLPPFIRDNFFDQLVLPKVRKAIEDWSAKKHTVSLHTLTLPWLPYIGLREEEFLGDAKRKLKSLMRDWKPINDVPNEFLVWKNVIDSSEWEELLLKYVVPKLGAVLREDFQVNPANQDMQPLKLVLLWSTILRPNVFSQLLESQFFPKWLRTLHQWLVHPKASFEEIAQWYSFWKGVFPDDVQQMAGVERGFSKGLQLMNKALELGPEASTRLPPPEFEERAKYDTKAIATSIKRPSRTQEITFRSIVEEFVASHNLLFIPVGRVEERSRMPLFRISTTADGKGGLLVYVLDDAMWALDGNEYRAIGLEDVVLRANKH